MLEQIEQLAQGKHAAEAHRNLQNQARLLLYKQRYLCDQLQQARRRLLDMEDKLKRLDKELQTARTLSLTDELTGLPNRRAFLQRLEEEMGRVRRQQVARCRFKVDQQEVPLPTFSAGVATHRDNEAPEAFIERADQALYRAKEGGRNKIESAD